MKYSNEFIDIAFGDSELEPVLAGLRGGETLSGSGLMALTDGISDDAMDELFGHLKDMDVLVDVSDLKGLGVSGGSALRLREEEQLAREEDLIRALDKNDPLRLYLQELAQIPACGDLDVLAMELADANRQERFDEGLFSRVLNLSLSHVVRIAREYTGCGVLLLDLIQEGSMGLWADLDCFCGGGFADFRDRSIHQAMSAAVIRQARACGLGQRLRQAAEDYRMVDERLLAELGRNPTPGELAEAMHMTEEEVETVRKTMENARLMGKARTETEEPDEPAPEDEQAVEDTAYYRTREKVDDLMSGLTELESKLLNLRFGLDGRMPVTAREAAQQLGLTAAEAVELEAAALAKMRRSGE